MTNDESSPNDEARKHAISAKIAFRHLSFCHSFVIRHSCFVIKGIAKELRTTQRLAGDIAWNDRKTVPWSYCTIADGLFAYRSRDDFLAGAGTCTRSRWQVGFADRRFGSRSGPERICRRDHRGSALVRAWLE